MRPRSRVSGEIRRLRRRDSGTRSPSHPMGRAADALTREEAERRWRSWFDKRGWRPYPFQEEVWRAVLEGDSGLLGVPTGSGKTYAALGGPFIDMLTHERRIESATTSLIYLTPVKALARDIARAIGDVIREAELPWTVAVRTGDTAASERTHFRKAPPDILITTPESLALMTSETGWRERYARLRFLIIDEWHELLGTKRGSLLELTLARLRHEIPGIRTWALSATLGNLDEAARIVTGIDQPKVIQAPIERGTDVSVMVPAKPAVWYGFGGLGLKRDLVDLLDPAASTILFTNTRTQAETWYETILRLRPDWQEILALHHGSLEREERERVEEGVKRGEIRFVVATSSLDLGVDFPHVAKVIQLGSVKSVARALQRAGRAEHFVGGVSTLICAPVNALEIFEIAALRLALKHGEIESKKPIAKPLDVLVQFLLTAALADGFRREEIEGYLKGAPSFREVTTDELDWALRFLQTGGSSLGAYPEFKKLECVDGVYSFTSPRLAHQHRLNIGTIVSNANVQVRFLGGKKIGFVDEMFILKLKPGDTFQLGGRRLQLVRVRDLEAIVRLAKDRKAVPASWSGQTRSISSILAHGLREIFAKPDDFLKPEECRIARWFLEDQARESHVPRSDDVLIERWNAKDGDHAFIYLFEGRALHEGFGHVLAERLSRLSKNTISVAANDYGFELLAARALPDNPALSQALMDSEHLDEDIQRSLDFPHLVKRTFREIARVAGMVQPTLRGRTKTNRQLQMSSGLLFDVLKNYDPENLLLRESFRQAREEQLDIERLREMQSRIRSSQLVFRKIERLTPLAFTLYVERTRSQVSSEALEDRIERMQARLLEEWHGT